ncbi:hypothetical protein [Allorhizobium terrae]|nr:hypothetical protein [Allorhizobium terrae]TWD57292.1 hypothetical protein FB480_10126 [Agrobacterium vitis]
MTANTNTIARPTVVQTKLSDNYRPIGLKAVIAAALMTPKTAKKKSA